MKRNFITIAFLFFVSFSAAASGLENDTDGDETLEEGAQKQVNCEAINSLKKCIDTPGCVWSGGRHKQVCLFGDGNR